MTNTREALGALTVLFFIGATQAQAQTQAQLPDEFEYDVAVAGDVEYAVELEIGGETYNFGATMLINANMNVNGVATAPPLDTTPPSAPSSLVATAGDESVGLAWPANSEPDLAGYNVYRSLTTGTGYSKINGALVETNSYNDTSLTNGTEYFYVVTALDDADTPNESGYSNEDSATPADVTAPDAPDAPTLTPGDTEIEVTLPSLTGDIVGFRVYVSTTEVGGYSEDTSSTQTSSWTIDGLSNGTTYYVRITAEDEAANESDQSDASSETPASAGITSLDELASTLAVWTPDPATWTLDGGSGRVTDLPDSGPSGLDLASISATGGPLPLEDHWGTGLHALQVDNLKYLRRVDATPSANDFSVVYVVDSGSTGYILAHRAVSLQAVTYSAPPIQINHNGAIGMGNSDATPISNISGYYSSSVEGPIVVRYERNRTAGTVSLWANGVRLVHLTGQTLTDYSATAEDIVLGHSSNNSGPSYIGQVWMGTDPDDAVLAEQFLGQQLLDAAPTPPCNYMGLVESDRSGALIHYAPRLALAYADAATNDPVTVLPDMVSLVAAVATNTGTGPFFRVDEFGTGLHGVRLNTADYLTHAGGYPADLNDVAIILAIKTPTSGTTGYTLNVGGAASGSGNPLQVQILSGNPRAILNDATVGSPINLNGTSPGADTACVLRIERVRNTGSADGYFRLYVDGSLAAESTGLSLDDWSSAQDIYIGASSGASHDTKLGEIVFCDPGDAATIESAVMSTFGVSP